MNAEEYTKVVTANQSRNNVYREGDLVVAKVVGNQTVEDVTYLNVEINKLVQEVEYKPNILVDITESGLADGPARKKVVSDFRDDTYNAMALYGLNEGIRVVATLIIGLTRQTKRMKLFKTEDDARFWLNNMPPDKTAKVPE